MQFKNGIKTLFSKKEKSFDINVSPQTLDLNYLFNPNIDIDYRKLSPLQIRTKLQALVTSCIDVRADYCAQCKPVIYRRKFGYDSIKNENYDNHPFIDLLYNPGSINIRTKHNLFYSTITNLDIWGNAYWLIIKNVIGQPSEIRMLNPNEMDYTLDSSGYPNGFKRTFTYSTAQNRNNKKEEYYSLDDIIHFKYPSYNVNNLLGSSIIQKNQSIIDIYLLQNAYQKNIIEKGGIPQIALKTDLKAPKQEVRDQIRQELNDVTGINNTGKPIILSDGLSIEKIQLNPMELGYIESKKVTRDEILTMFQVPAGVLNITENVNKSNNESSINMFLTNTIKKIMQIIDGELSIYIQKNYSNKLYLEHELNYEQTFKDKKDAMLDGVKAGAIPLNEYRTFLNLETLPELEQEDRKFFSNKYTVDDTTTNNNNTNADNNTTDENK